MGARERIILLQGDITTEESDAIVNAANTDLILGAGVAGAIAARGGPVIQQECTDHGPVELGGAALTRGGNLPAKFVIHAAAMHLGGNPSEDSIRRSTINSLRIAYQEKMTTISFPALGTGIGGFGMEDAALIMLSATIGFLEVNEYPENVRFVLFDETGLSIFKRVFTEL